MLDNNKDWVQLAIERESTPRSLRIETREEFLKKYEIPSSTYYYEVNKKENQEKILEISLNLAKAHTPDVLENLAKRAENNTRDAELFLDYVLKLAKNLDIKSDGKPIPFLDYVRKDYSNGEGNKHAKKS